MFRAVLSIFLLAAFAVQTFHKGGIVVSYYLNKEAYAKNCVNKTKPILKCHGKCQMAKKILEQEKQDEQAPERKPENKFQSLYFKSHFATLGYNKTVSLHSYQSYAVMPIPSAHPDTIFHPPCMV